MPSPSPTLEISKCLVIPLSPPDSTAGLCHLTPWDLPMLSPHYIQKGLLFSDLPPSLSIATITDRLKSSLSLALLHFYPLAGRLTTELVLDSNNKVSGRRVSIECKGQGSEFVHAVASNVTVSDVLAPGSDVPSFIQSFFPLNGAVNYDGHSLPLLSVQLTELSDGVFVACSFNHVVGDGTSYWHFFNAWAEIARSKEGSNFTLSRPPVHDRWFIEGESPPITLPFSDEVEFIERHDMPPLRERIFHFSARSIARLKEKANKECDTNAISSFQALSSLVWRCITRVRRFPPDQQTSSRMAIQNRARLQPPLSSDYFGNSIGVAVGTATAGELMAAGLGRAALLLHQAIRAHTDGAIRALVKRYHEKPVVYRLSMFDRCSVMMGSSPRFDMYTCDFGWGKPVAVRSSTANKFEGKVTSYPGREGGGSVDLEVCLSPKDMASLEKDEEFMAAARTT